jgi:hypothetical protein
MVDDATGNKPTEGEMAWFAAVVYDLVWARLPREALEFTQ